MENFLEKLGVKNYKKLSNFTDENGVENITFSTDIDNLTLNKVKYNKHIRTHVYIDNVFKESFPEKSDTLHEYLLNDKERKIKAQDFCESFYSKIKEAGNHPYLKAKRIKDKVKCYNKDLVIPIYKFMTGDHSVLTYLVSLQYISESDKTFKQHTTPLKDIAFFTSEKTLKKKYKYIYICEGYADNITIRDTIGDSKCLVVSALCEKNILKIYDEFRRRYNFVKIILVLDSENAHSTNYDYLVYKDRDLGIVKIDGHGKYVKDVNDLHILDNPHSDKICVSKRVKDLLMDYKNIFFELNCLGTDENDNYYFTTTENKKIIKLKNDFGKRNLKRLATNAFFKRRFPRMDDDNTISGINWDGAIEFLEVMSRKKGRFNKEDVISTGISANKKENKLICNVDGQNIIGPRDPSKFYVEGNVYPNPNNYKEKTVSDKMLKIFNTIAYSNPESGKIHLAHLVFSTIGSACPFRPVIYFTGEYDSGKSYILQDINSPTISSFAQTIQGTATSAGIKNLSSETNCPIHVDEAEFGSKNNESRFFEICDIIRNSCSTSGGFKHIQANRTGGYESFELKSTFTLASIKVVIEDPALLSRTIFLTPTANLADSEQFKRLEQALKYDFVSEFKCLYTRIFNNYDKFLILYREYYLKYKKIKGKPTGHFAKNMAVINATLRIITKDFGFENVISEDNLLEHSHMGLNQESGGINQIDNFGQIFINIVKDQIVRVNHLSNESLNVEQIVKSLIKFYNNYAELETPLYIKTGVFIIGDEVFIKSKSTIVANLCKRNNLGANYPSILKKSFGLVPERRAKKIGLIEMRVMCINITKFFD